MQIVAQNNLYTVRLYGESGIVTHQMHGFVEGENFRKMLLAGLKAFQENGCDKWLSDDSKNPMVNQEDLAWGRENWEPKVIEGGWKFWAIVVPEKIFGKMAMRGVIQRYKEMGVTAEIFKTYDDALAWLQEQ